MKKIAIIGAGFSGSVIANQLAVKECFKIDVYESRSHIGGNCHTERDGKTGILKHVYGPHIFHTNNEKVWAYVNQYDVFKPFVNKVKAISNNQVYSLPINLHTINQFYKRIFSPSEAEIYINGRADQTIEEPASFEEQALKFIGKELYEEFLLGYTLKQWGIHPSKLPASILKRLPVRFNYNDNYFNDKYQGIPENGYTYIMEKLLSHKSISVFLNQRVTRIIKENYDHVFYSGPIDEWFDYSKGKLGYRTLVFEEEVHDGDYQGNPVINYCDQKIEWTRITEHKHFAPWEKHDQTIIYREFSKEYMGNEIPYYPIRLARDKEILKKYIILSEEERNITFVGRLGTYKYLDMHITIEQAMETSDKYLSCQRTGQEMPRFVHSPL